MKRILFIGIFFLLGVFGYSQTWTEESGIPWAGTGITFQVITKQEYDRLLKLFIEDGYECKIFYDDVFYINNNEPYSGIRPSFNGYYYLYGVFKAGVDTYRVLAYGNSSTGRLEIVFGWGGLKSGSSDFYNLYNKYIRRVNGE